VADDRDEWSERRIGVSIAAGTAVLSRASPHRYDARRRETRMRRRAFIAGLAATAAGVRLVQAQTPANVPVIGFLHPGSLESGSLIPDALREGLRESGYVVNETIRIEDRRAQEKPEVLPQLVQEPNADAVIE
jgi:hypothetical protein